MPTGGQNSSTNKITNALHFFRADVNLLCWSNKYKASSHLYQTSVWTSDCDFQEAVLSKGGSRCNQKAIFDSLSAVSQIVL